MLFLAAAQQIQVREAIYLIVRKTTISQESGSKRREQWEPRVRRQASDVRHQFLFFKLLGFSLACLLLLRDKNSEQTLINTKCGAVTAASATISQRSALDESGIA